MCGLYTFYWFPRWVFRKSYNIKINYIKRVQLSICIGNLSVQKNTEPFFGRVGIIITIGVFTIGIGITTPLLFCRVNIVLSAGSLKTARYGCSWNRQNTRVPDYYSSRYLHTYMTRIVLKPIYSCMHNRITVSHIITQVNKTIIDRYQVLYRLPANPNRGIPRNNKPCSEFIAVFLHVAASTCYLDRDTIDNNCTPQTRPFQSLKARLIVTWNRQAFGDHELLT